MEVMKILKFGFTKERGAGNETKTFFYGSHHFNINCSICLVHYLLGALGLKGGKNGRN